MKKLMVKLVRLLLILLIGIVLVAYAVVRPSPFNAQTDTRTITANPEALQNHVKHLSENLSPRSHKDIENLHATAEYIQKELLQFSDRVKFQNYPVKEQIYSNVVAKFGPDTEELIVVGAHYDVMGEHAGADDNASGVAGLLELARLLSAIELNQSVELVAYTLEEPPYFASNKMGSFIHAESVKGRDVQLMISLEMIGYFSDEPGSQYFPIKPMEWIYPTTGNFISIVDQVFSNAAKRLKDSINKHTDLPAYSTNAPTAIQGIDFSDHRNYWHFGFPAVMVTDTSFYRNLNYHTTEDTFEKLDYQAMAKVVYGVFKHVEALASKE
ncbi:M28 family peptidase [Marinicella rhabdoformis]|uniref:M28 family peptidase n=1 Tax=Marinicella rhabdoformis TaxID=2580566 RepID=UPI0015D02968|nr:M28 family peptidase [Marinicella rhabdoformis]